MDRRSIIGFVLIGIVLMSWLFWNSSTQKKPVETKKQDSTVISNDTSKKNTTPVTPNTTKTSGDTKITKKSGDSTIAELKNDTLTSSLGTIFAKLSAFTSDSTSKTEKIIQIENSKAKMEFSSFGGTIVKYTAKDFNTWDNKPVQLVDWKKGKELHLVFTSKDGKLISTENLIFNADYTAWEKIDLQQKKDFKLTYTLNIVPDGSQKIVKTYTFLPDAYEFDVDYELINSDKFISGSKYQVVWGSSLNLTEHRSDDEATFAEAFAHMAGDLQQLDATKVDEPVKEDYNGNTDFVSMRNKYFGIYIIPSNRKGDGAYLSGFRENLKDKGVRENYTIAVKMDIKNEAEEKASFRILIVPMDYSILKSYGLELEKTLRFALDFIVRPIAQFVIIPFFLFLHSFIPNFGIVIIVFAICMKIVLNPLTKTQTNSMKKMGKLGPKMKELREKYKDDPVKANQAIMKLYKEEKINPAGGCLPMLLQLPILYALFGVFRSTIELRHAPFFGWINDLSAPDILFHLPFTIPIFGISDVSGLATLLGVTMFLQQKMSVTDPSQKALVYVMPVMLTLLFYSFPSGLNLYYLVFNVLSIGQQYYTTRKEKLKAENEITVLDSGAKVSKTPLLKDRKPSK
ncbi:membrane protein insertase YidC [soil metagenome]